jgi:hypothetical protein
MVHAYQKGELPNAPESVKRTAGSISEEDAEHFAKTKHDGLPEKKKKDDEMNKESAYINGFFSKCAEYGIPYHVACGLYKRASNTNGVSSVHTNNLNELAGHLANAGAMEDAPHVRSPFTVQTGRLGADIGKKRLAYNNAVNALGLPAFSNAVNRAVARTGNRTGNNAYELWDEYARDAIKPQEDDVPPPTPPAQETPPWALSGWTDSKWPDPVVELVD